MSMEESRVVGSVLVLPVYWWILILTLLSAAGHSSKLLLLGYDSGMQYGITAVSALEGLCWGCGHAIYEGCAVLLCQRGAGYRGFRWAVSLGLVWGAFTAVVVAIHYSNWCRGFELECPHQQWSFSLMVAWECLGLSFYSCLWLLPSRCLYRRPALHDYAVYQALTRALMALSLLMVWCRVDVGFCIELFGDTALAGVVTPIMLFRALFQDSAFWQGKLPSSAGLAAKGTCCSGSWKRSCEFEGPPGGGDQGLEAVLVEGRYCC